MDITERINQVKHAIAEAEISSHRPKGSVKLLAVSKGQSIEKIQQAFQCGLTEFGENYFQEAEKKINALRNLAINWHFIGPIQSNKAKEVATLFSWVHSVDRLKVAKLLHQHRPSQCKPLNFCLQINLSGEHSKSGLSKEAAFELIDQLSAYTNIHCRGLMTIPPAEATESEQLALFLELKALLEQINHTFKLHLDTLSMGMSHDLQTAIHAGSTIVRIGQAIFGKRQ